MQFTPRRKPLSFDERLAMWSMALLGGSVVVIAVLVALAFTIATRSVWLMLAVACLGVYAAQFYFLATIGRYEPRQRLLVWQLSLLGHLLLFGVVAWLVGNLSVALVVLLPEAASGAIHVVAISRALKVGRAA